MSAWEGVMYVAAQHGQADIQYKATVAVKWHQPETGRNGESEHGKAGLTVAVKSTPLCRALRRR